MSYSVFVRRLFALLLSSITLVACDMEEYKMKKVASIPVSDAAYIYTRSGNRSGSDDGFSGVWKVTVNGEEVKLQALDDDGDVVDIEIISIKNIFGNYLVADTEAGRVLVNKTSNKVYKCPIHLTGESYCRVDEYPTGTLYYHDFNMIYKSLISEQSVTEEELLPEGQWGYDFLIGKDETLFYTGFNYCSGIDGKILTKGKRLYPIEDNAFMFFGTADHNIYSFNVPQDLESIQYIYKWENSGDNEIVKKMICEIPNGEVFAGPFVPINNINGKVVLFTINRYDYGYYIDYDNVDYVRVYEFDGKSCVLKRTYTTTEELKAFGQMCENIADVTSPNYGYYPLYRTIGKTNVYFMQSDPRNDGFAVSLDPVTYEIKCISCEIPRNEYEVYTKRTEASWGKLLFTGLRYSDSSIVLGEVDAEGNVSIVSERASEYHITEYCALN